MDAIKRAYHPAIGLMRDYAHLGQGQGQGQAPSQNLFTIA